MLNPKKYPLKTHAQVMEEAYGKIPVYSSEWTNFNPSDPGITILENLTAFQILQQNQMDTVTDAVKEGLLKLVGYTPRKGACSRVLLEAFGVKEPILMPADQRFMVGNISFETALAGKLTDNRLIGVYGKDKDGFHNYSYVLDADIPVSARIFTRRPAAGMELYLVLEKRPEPQEIFRIYAKVGNRYGRNPFGEDRSGGFASITWQCYTQKGFVEIEVEDQTKGFLEDGELCFTMPQEEAAVYEEGPLSGYIWRAVLTDADYDVAPEVLHLSGFLFEAWQKETLAITHTFQKPSEVVLTCTMMEEGYVRVYCKEEKGSSYRLYEEITEPEGMGEGPRGRYYRRQRMGYGTQLFVFDKGRYGYGPGRLKNAVKVVVYNEEMMRKYYLGEVLGCDNQRLVLPRGHIVPDTFSLLAVRPDGDGGFFYDFVKPGRAEENALFYELDEEAGQIVIRDAGDYIAAKLYLASIAVMMGEDGNVRPQNVFIPQGYEDEIRFTNPAPGKGGCFRESLAQVRRRFVSQLYAPAVAVLEKDYEMLALKTPGLCISKVHAWMDQERNEVQIAVRPNTQEPFARLSENYLRRIQDWLEEHRLLSTRIVIRQPMYVKVHVQGRIYVKPHYENCEEQLREVIVKALDYVNGNQGFGEILRFEQLFLMLEEQEMVVHIYDLSLRPETLSYASVEGADLRPAPNCLFCPGQIRLELNTFRDV